MKKLAFIFAVFVSGISFSQKHTMIMTNYAMSYAYTMDYDSLVKIQFGDHIELGFVTENKYEVDGTSMTISYYVDNEFSTKGKLLSFKETSTQVLFSFMDHGLTSNKDFIRYGVFNKIQREGEPKFIIYNFSAVDNKTTVSYYTID